MLEKVKQMHLLIHIDPCLIMIRKPFEPKRHIGFIHYCEVYTKTSMKEKIVLFLITYHLVGSFGEGKTFMIPSILFTNKIYQGRNPFAEKIHSLRYLPALE